jgi:hypothetical protein
LCFFVDAKLTWNDADGIHGVSNERDMEAGAMGQQMQASVEDLATLALAEIIQEQMQVSVNVGKTL